MILLSSLFWLRQFWICKLKYLICLLKDRFAFLIGLSLLAMLIILQGSKRHDHKKEVKVLNSKILCLINTSKNLIRERAVHINATWAQRCDKALYMSYDENINLPYLKLQIPETRRLIWDKWRLAFKWVIENEIENYDYILRADDNTYIIMENLKAFLFPYNPNEAYIFGSTFKHFVKTGYPSGGPGVIFSREALKQFVRGMYNLEICPEIISGLEDIGFGECAEKLNITKIDTRDNRGRMTQLSWTLADHFTTGLNPEQMGYLLHPYKNNRFECCSDYIISFHYIHKELIYALEFLIYQAKKYEIADDNTLQKAMS